MIRSQEEAQDCLGPFSDRLQACVTRAVAEYQTIETAALRAQMSKRSDASIINDLIWSQLRSEFEGDFVFSDRRNRRLMHVGGDFNLRVKKLDGGMRPRNIFTQLVLDYLEQHPQMHLPGMGSPTNVDLCYTRAGAAEVAVQVYLRCPRDRNDFFWLWEFDEPAAGVEPAAQPLAPPEPPRRVRPRSEETALEEPADESSAG